MSAFNTASLLLFPGLGLVALGIGLLSRRYSASALAVGLAGLLILATASTWINSAGGMTGFIGRSKSYYAREAILRQIEDIEDYYLVRRRLGRRGPRVTLETPERQLERRTKR